MNGAQNMALRQEKQVSHEDIVERLERGDNRFRCIEEKMDAILNSLEGIRSEVGATKEIVEAWGAVKTAGKFIKWLGGVVAAAIAILVAAKAGIAHILTSGVVK